MIVSGITELYLFGVFERGIPNKERIVFRAMDIVSLGQYGIMLGVRTSSEFAVPIKDNLFWFGDGVIRPGDWLFVYTGPGRPQVNEVPNSDERMFTLHWDRKSVILKNENVVPILFRVEAVIVEKSPTHRPELKSKNS